MHLAAFCKAGVMILLLLIAPPAFAHELKPVREFPMPGHVTLLLPVPEAWHSEFSATGAEQPANATAATVIATITLTPPSGDTFDAVISIFRHQSDLPGYYNPEALKPIITAVAADFLPRAVEQEATLTELKGADGGGYCFTLTDRAPAPGEFPYLTHCGLGVGNLLLAISILHQERDDQAVTEALTMLRRARQRPDTAPEF